MRIFYKINFLDYWSLGSGQSGGASFDSAAARDAEGFCYVPAKTLKGCLREVAEGLRDEVEAAESRGTENCADGSNSNLADVADVAGVTTAQNRGGADVAGVTTAQNGGADFTAAGWTAFIETCFGAAAASYAEQQRAGECYFGNAELAAALKAKLREQKLTPQLFAKVAQTALDGDFGTAKDGSLREIEVVKPVALFGEICGVPAHFAPLMRRTLGGLRRMGLNRTRGLGRLAIEVLGSVAEAGETGFDGAKAGGNCGANSRANGAKNAELSAKIPAQSQPNSNLDDFAAKVAGAFLPATAQHGAGAKKLRFKLTLLSDIVLAKNANTEGAFECLDFFGGSVFLGAVARHFGEFAEPVRVFFGGDVRFGAAKPLAKLQIANGANAVKNGAKTCAKNGGVAGANSNLAGGKRAIAYKMPLCFYEPKSNDAKRYFNALLSDISAPKMLEKQLKQLKGGFVAAAQNGKNGGKNGSENGSENALQRVSVEQNFSQKINLRERRDKNGDTQMYGYQSLRRGSEWGFEVSFAADVGADVAAQVARALCAAQRLGKSRSAEFSRVKIELLCGGEREWADVGAGGAKNCANGAGGTANSNLGGGVGKNAGNGAINADKNLAYFYIDSPLALFDPATGAPTFDLAAIGVGAQQIEREKCFVKTHVFAPYNVKRRGFDSARFVIEPGSVIAVRGLDAAQRERVERGVGGFLSEGYGRVLVNPPFLAVGENVADGAEDVGFAMSEAGKNDENDGAKEIFDGADGDFRAACEVGQDGAARGKLLGALRSAKNARDGEYGELDAVEKFIDDNAAKFAKLQGSQWGAIRAIAHFAFDDCKKSASQKERLDAAKSKVVEQILDFTTHGVSETQWERGRGALLDFAKERGARAVELLAMRMLAKTREKNASASGGANAKNTIKESK